MSGGVGYQALARKYRPENFDELSGQSEVVAALKNSLSSGKIHHAYLLSGTRGSGKTTIARIMAKALECEAGNPAQPCCSCETCKSIAAGDFIDVTEIDAASRTGIEDMRELIENVMYKPVKGKYKIFIIDEVHMLSLSSFNALLKTLEEPPEHVKFILATTDPQKLPVTVLSRCVHFRFLPLPAELIKERLAYVLTQENVTHDGDSLELIASKSGGSMRDALSITDQMVSLCAGNLIKSKVADALGCLDDNLVFELAASTCMNDVARSMAAMEKIKLLNPGYKSVLDAIISCIHATVMSRALNKCGQSSDVYKHSAGMDAVPDSILHLAYQILLNAKRDFDLAPSQELAFEMTVMRLLSYASIAWTQETGAGDANSSQTVKKNFSEPVNAKSSPDSSVLSAAASLTPEGPKSEEENLAAINGIISNPKVASSEIAQEGALPNAQISASAPSQSSQMSQISQDAGEKTPEQSESSAVENSEQADMELLSQLLAMGRVQQAPQIPRPDVSDEPPASNWKPGPSSVFGKNRIGEEPASSSEDANESDASSETKSAGENGANSESVSVLNAPFAEPVAQVCKQENESAGFSPSVPDNSSIFDAQNSDSVGKCEAQVPDAMQNFAPHDGFDSVGLAAQPASSEIPMPAANVPANGYAPIEQGLFDTINQGNGAAQPSGFQQTAPGFQNASEMNTAANAAPSGTTRFDCAREYFDTDTMPRVAEKDPWTDAIMKMNLSDMTKTMLIGTSCDIATGAIRAPSDFAFLLTEDVLQEVRAQYLKIVPKGSEVPKFKLETSDETPDGTPSELMRRYYDKLCWQQFDKLQSDEHFQELVKRFGCSVGISNIHLLKG